MIDPFESAKRTIARANHHIADMEKEISAFTSVKPWSYVVEPHSTQHNHKIVFNRRLPDNLPSILFDAVSSLRATLDQCGYACATAAKSPSLKHIKFPFAKDKDHWANAVAGGCKDLPIEIQALFGKCIAYKEGDSFLWALNEICNTQKHLALVPFSIGTATVAMGKEEPVKKTFNPEPGIAIRFEISGRLLFAGGPIAQSNPDWNREKNEIVLFRSEDGGAGLNHQPTVVVNVAVDGIDVLAHRPVINVLKKMSETVAQIGAATESECRRIGLIS